MRATRLQHVALLSLLVITALALAPGNSDSRRLKRHEILVAQTATEMLERGDFLVPYVLGEPRLKKPPLSYWMAIAAHRILGQVDISKVSELEVRLPSLISGLLVVLASYGLGLFVTRDPRGGLIAAGLIATSGMFFLSSRNGRPEMLYTLLCTLILLGFVMAVRRAEEGRSTTGAAMLGWGAFGIALMAKGPQFPIFILLGVLITLLLRRPRLPISGVLHPWMALPAVALPLAYYAYLAFQVDNAVALWSAEMEQGGGVPLWVRPLRFYYPLVLVAGVAPWVIAFGVMLVDVWKRRDSMVLLLANCLLVSLLLVSFAGKLRPHFSPGGGLTAVAVADEASQRFQRALGLVVPR